MKVIMAVKSELLKLRHTAHWLIHAIVPIVGAILFVTYFALYQNRAIADKVKLIMDLTAMMFPLLISVIVGQNITQEEKASHFQNLLAVPNRKVTFTAKLFVLSLSGIISLLALYVLFSFGIVLGGMGTAPFKTIIPILPGIALSAIFLYALHLFVNLKYGIGLSLFFGVFECMQCILYSNITLRGGWRYIPFSWSSNWIQDVLSEHLVQYRAEWIIIVSITIGVLLLFTIWFSHWEGRNNE